MPCEIKIKKLLTEKVKEMTEDGLNRTIKYAKKVEKEVNSFFNSNVVYFTQEGDFINNLKVSPAIKKELKDITPFNYTGL